MNNDDANLPEPKSAPPAHQLAPWSSLPLPINGLGGIRQNNRDQ